MEESQVEFPETAPIHIVKIANEEYKLYIFFPGEEENMGTVRREDYVVHKRR